MDREIAKGLSQELRDALDPLLAEIESLIKDCGWKDGDRDGPAKTQESTGRKKKKKKKLS
jgi:hypothetical protein